MALIVGLGNPGVEYKGTRHNIGFELIDKVSELLTITLQPGSGLFFFGEGQFKGKKVTLLKPMAYMNRSGKAVKKFVAAAGMPLSECLICYDDIHLEPGQVRIKPGGSPGGHNGLADIVAELGSRDVPRLRIGIGSDFPRGRQSDYVLSPFAGDQRPLVDGALDVASDAILAFLRGGIHLAMNEYN